MHRLLFVLAAFGCSHPQATGPKWPEQSTTAEDGGESIAPRESATYAAAAIEKSADSDETTPVAASSTSAVSAMPGDAVPASAPAVQSTSDDVFTTEEIIIEIDE